MTQITSDAEKYARCLTVQGDNPHYSAGNVALTMSSPQSPLNSVSR